MACWWVAKPTLSFEVGSAIRMTAINLERLKAIILLNPCVLFLSPKGAVHPDCSLFNPKEASIDLMSHIISKFAKSANS